MDTSKSYDIYTSLRKDIERGVYEAGSLLPGELVLSEKFHVSRETVRKALFLLVDNGYIQKKRGKGSIVLDVNKYNFPVSEVVSFKELQDLHDIKTKTKVVKNKRVSAPEFLVQSRLVAPREDMFCLVRSRSVDGECAILDKDYVVARFASELPNKAVKHSLYNYLEEQCGVKIAYAKKVMTVELVTDEDKKYMDIEGDTHVVVVRSEVYTENTDFVQYSESRHKLDKFRFVDFARRKIK